MTSPVSHEGFLSWCLGLVDRDVAVSSPDGTAKAIFGRVLDFHLATSLRIPVHTVRRASDGREVDLVASLHGLAAIKNQEVPSVQDVDLKVSLLQLQAILQPEDFRNVLSAVRRAAREGQTVECADDSEDRNDNALPHAAKPVLLAAGFAPSDSQGLHWVFGNDHTKKLAMLEEIAENQAKGFRNRVNSGARAYNGVEPDSEMVSQLAAIFSENGASGLAQRSTTVPSRLQWSGRVSTRAIQISTTPFQTCLPVDVVQMTGQQFGLSLSCFRKACLSI